MSGAPDGSSPLGTTVTVVQWVTVVALVVFVGMLFINPPSGSLEADEGGGGGEAGAVDGAAVYAGRCASCHGGDGGGGSGPALAGRVVEAFPEVADQVAVVTDGRNGMPAFSSRLSSEEIEAVVEFTRTL